MSIKEKHFKLGLHFWITLFGYILHPIQVKEPSRKSVINFISKARTVLKNKQSYVKCNLSGNVTVYYNIQAKMLKLRIV